jgi:malonate transporter and related proteins
LVPVILVIAVGYLAGRVGWIGGEGTRSLSTLVFMVLGPVALFRAMTHVDVGDLDFSPLFSYFVAAGLVFGAVMLVLGWSRRSAVIALGCTFSNSLTIGVPLVELAFGPKGLVLLLTLISVHALVLLTTATLVLELAPPSTGGMAGQEEPTLDRSLGRALAAQTGDSTAQRSGSDRPWSDTSRRVLTVIRNAVLHPVPLPILAGLLYAQTGWGIHPVVDKPLVWLAGAFGPMALLLVGASLSATPVVGHVWAAVKLSTVKLVVHPALMLVVGWGLGLRGLALLVMVTAAALPMGANVFLFSQRYGTGETLVTAAVALSTLMAVASLLVWSSVLGWMGIQP